MRKIITLQEQYYLKHTKLIILSKFSLLNTFTINCLHLANDSSCRHASSWSGQSDTPSHNM